MNEASEIGCVTTRAGEIVFSRTGGGLPLLLLHATSHDRRDYEQILPLLAQRYQVLAVDLPGHGDSRHVLAPMGAPALADAVEEFIEALCLERVAFVGNSVGGYIGARFAIRHPDRCWALVLVQTGGFLPPSFRLELACRILGRPSIFRRFAPALAKRYVNARGAADRAVAKRASVFGSNPSGARVCSAVWRSFLDPEHDLRARAARIRAPTMVIWGGRDPIRPVAEGHDTLRYIPNVELAILDTGHVPFASDPDGFMAVTQPFLERASAALAGSNQ